MATFETTGTFNNGILIGPPSSVGTPPLPTTVGTGINEVKVNAALELQASGLMPARMTTAEIQALSAPAIEGQPSPMGPVQLIFNTDTQSMVTVLNGDVSSMVGSVKRWSMTWEGRTSILAAFTPANFTIAVTQNQSYFPYAFAGRAILRGEPFETIPNDLTVSVNAASEQPLNYLKLDCTGLFLGAPVGDPTRIINVANFAPAGNTDGGLIHLMEAGSTLWLTLLTGNVGGFTGGDDTTTLTIDIFYI